MIAISPIDRFMKKMFVELRNCDDTETPNRTTATSARSRPVSHRTSERMRSGTEMRLLLLQDRCEPQGDPPVERDRAEQQRAGDRLIPERRHAEHVQGAENRL